MPRQIRHFEATNTILNWWWVGVAGLMASAATMATADGASLASPMIVMAGAAGALAGIGLHEIHVEKNPFWVRRRIFGLQRGGLINSVGIGALVCASALFLLGLFRASANEQGMFTLMAGASALFYFGVVYWVCGWIVLSRARERLRGADTLQRHVWRTDYETDGPAFSRGVEDLDLLDASCEDGPEPAPAAARSAMRDPETSGAAAKGRQTQAA
ncbi:hypothetical protein AB1M95_00430 [Sulfitobacter sp. LCG007]